MKVKSWFLILGATLGLSGFSEAEKTVTLHSISGQPFEVFENTLRTAYLSAFGLGKSTNFAERIENEDGTVTLVAPKYTYKNETYPIALTLYEKESVGGACMLYGFSATQSWEKNPAKNINCATIDKGGHFAGLKPSHIPEGHESFYTCLSSITCIF